MLVYQRVISRSLGFAERRAKLGDHLQPQRKKTNSHLAVSENDVCFYPSCDAWKKNMNNKNMDKNMCLYGYHGYKWHIIHLYGLIHLYT